MKTVAVALVFIAGAAVVLWYGNTLNSLVLGGLIGGLAALLISIPISVTLFSYLSRRHDERLRAELQEYEDFSLAQLQPSQDKPVYVIDSEEEEQDGPAFLDEAGWQEEISYRQRPSQYYLAAPESAQRVSRKLAEDTRSTYTTSPSPSPKKQPVRGKTQFTQRPTPQRGLSTGFPGYQSGNFRSQALRAAREEAVRQNDEERDEISSTHAPRRTSPIRPMRQPFEQEEEFMAPREQPRPARQAPQPSEKHYSQRPRSNRDGSTSPTGSRRPSAQEDESTVRQSRRSGIPRTDQLDPDILSNTLNKPLQRRAPYMYDDDELREELSQRIDTPATRRSSRKLVRRPDEE